MDLKFKDNSKLKLGITQLEYIESTGTQWIDTGVKPTNNTRLQCEVDNLNSGILILFGCRTGEYEENFCVTTDNEHRLRYGNQQENANATDKIILDANKNRWIINSTTVTFNLQTFLCRNNFALFGCNKNGTIESINKSRVYYCTFYENGDIICNLIPVIDRNNTVCMYDTVSKTFFYNQGIGDFVAGPEVPSTINPLPNNIILKTITIYHKNTPNVDGLQLLNGILNYQKTHQDEIKELYYPTTQLWQDIITEYPDILYWYNINHKLCIPICEADDSEQCAEDFLDAASGIQQELEDYPDLIPIIAEYPAVASVITEYPSLIPIIIENPEVVHSLVNTEYENWLQADGSSWLVTNYYINGNTDVECRACILNYNGNTNASPMLYGGASAHKGAGGEMYGWDNNFNFNYYNNIVTFTTSEVPINVKFKAETTAGFINISLDNGNTLTGGSADRLTFNSGVPTVVFALNRGSVGFKSATSKLSSLKFKEGVDKLWLVPIQNNGNPCMIDLLTGTKYLNQGTGSFTYSLESKNA